VGQGVVDPLGEPPGQKWALVISLINNPRVEQAARALLSGQQVESIATEIAITWTAAAPVRGTLRIRDADTTQRYVLDITVAALTPQEVAALQHPDPAGVATSIDAWVDVTTPTTQVWELFNCRVESVFIGRA
jgi:hypothetical protein